MPANAHETQHRMLIVKSSQAAGLGDLIRSALCGVAYARLSGRQLFIDWRGDIYRYGQGRNLFEALFELKGVEQAREVPDGNDVHPPAWRGALARSFTELWADHGNKPWDRKTAIETYSFDLSRLDYPQDVLVMWEFDQFHRMREALAKEGIPPALEETQALSAIFTRHLSLRPAIRERVDREWSQVEQGMDILGVHVRLTDESVRARGSVALERYIKAIDRALAKHRISRIFLATDNLCVQDSLSSLYGDKLFVCAKWLPKPGEALHLNNRDCPDTWKNITDAMVDVFMLSRCKALLCQTASSYAQLAIIIGNMESNSVYDVSFDREPVSLNRLLRYARKTLGA